MVVTSFSGVIFLYLACVLALMNIVNAWMRFFEHGPIRPQKKIKLPDISQAVLRQDFVDELLSLRQVVLFIFPAFFPGLISPCDLNFFGQHGHL